MKNMKVSMKLIVSFLIVIVLAVAVGIVGILGMYKINDADHALYSGNYLPSVMAGDISQTIVEQRVHMRNFVIYDSNADAAVFKKAQDSLTTSRKEMEEFFSSYKETIVNPEDEDAYDELVKVYNSEWIPLQDTLLSLGIDNKTEEAKKALTDASLIAGKMDELSTKLQQVNLSDGKKAVDANSALFNTMTIIEIITLVIAVAIAMFLAFYISSLISKPLAVLTAFMKKAGTTGDITLSQADVENITRLSQVKDEIGQCIGSTANFVNHMTEVGRVLETVAGGDLTVDFKLLSDKDSMGLAINKMEGNLNNMFSEINASSSQVSIGSGQVANGSQSLAQGATEQASSVEELSASISEVAEKTKRNAQMADEAARLSGDIRNNAEKGSQQMDQLMQAVTEINEAGQSISKVIKVIDDIAFQTNILALNAAVEAARAGQHGKGFAVVADEVRNLAAKSAESAKDTSSLIENSIEKSHLGLNIATETSASLKEIVDGINKSAEIVSEIAQSSDEQAIAISQINTGIDQVSQVIQQNSATAEESAAASEEMSGQASLLLELISRFKIKNAHTAQSFEFDAVSPKIAHKQPAAAYDDSGFGKY